MIASPRTRERPRTITALLAILAAQALAAQALFVFFLRRPEFVDGNIKELLRLFCPAQILLSLAAAAAILRRHCGWRWLAGLAAIFALSLGAECAGSGRGLVFGRYYFTPLFGPKLFGLVPVLVPLSWFTLAISSWALASRLYSGRLARILGGTALMVAWDFCADPVLVQTSPTWLPRGWVWLAPGPFYGVPWSNFAGWVVVSMVLISTLSRFSWARFEGSEETYWPWHFAAHLLGPFGLALVMGLWNAALATAVLIGACVALRVSPSTPAAGG